MVISFYSRMYEGHWERLNVSMGQEKQHPSGLELRRAAPGLRQVSIPVRPPPTPGFLFCGDSLAAEHEACIKHRTRELKAVLVLNIQNSQRISFSAIQ